VTDNLLARIERLMIADAFVAVHGGAGTLVEVALAWNLLQVHDLSSCPLILLGPDWRALVEVFARHLIVNEQDLGLLTVVDSPEDVLDALASFDPGLAPITRAGG
jgi:predicted Rossmann-fold nucleotide-binding protein